MTKKRSSEILDDRRTFFKICQRFRIWSENKLSPNFCPPIFMTSLRLWVVRWIFFVKISFFEKRSDEGVLERVTGHNGIGHNGTDKMVAIPIDFNSIEYILF